MFFCVFVRVRLPTDLITSVGVFGRIVVAAGSVIVVYVAAVAWLSLLLLQLPSSFSMLLCGSAVLFVVFVAASVAAVIAGVAADGAGIVIIAVVVGLCFFGAVF